MVETIDTPQSKTEDESGRPIRYITTVMFRDTGGHEWLRHEYIRLDGPLLKEKIVMEFERLDTAPPPKPKRKAYGRRTEDIRKSIRPFNFK